MAFRFCSAQSVNLWFIQTVRYSCTVSNGNVMPDRPICLRFGSKTIDHLFGPKTMFLPKLCSNHRLIAGQNTRTVFTTSCLLAEPLKRKKRIDPALLKRREERRIKKLEKEIRRLELTPKQFKPIIELQLTPQIIKELPQRQRPITDTEPDKQLERISKLWSIYRCEQTLHELRSIKAMADSQKRALEVLRRESPELYAQAISIDPNLIPYKSGDYVKKETPSRDSYVGPDGRKTDVTKQWTM